MIFHLILNSILVFTVLALAVEFIIFAFKICNARFRYLCRLLPLLKFPFDLIIFAVKGESFFHNYNPFSCEFEALGYLQTVLKEQEAVVYKPILIPQYISNYLPEHVIDGFLTIALLSSVVIFAVKISQLFRSMHYLNRLFNYAQPSTRDISNLKLSESLKRNNAQIFISDQIFVPFAAGHRYIFLPTALIDTLSQEEFEAVIAHELEHLRWKDPLLRILSNVLCATFWWIPAGWFVKKLEEDQEEASDDTLYKYDIEPYALGSALVKTIKGAKLAKLKMAVACPLTSFKKSHERRLNNLIQPKVSQSKWVMVASGIFCVLAFLSFWAC